MGNVYRIVTLPGDGIGPEVLHATERVLTSVVDSIDGLDVKLDRHEAGAQRHRETGVAITDQTMQACLDADAVLLAAIGLPDVRRADGTEVQPQMMMRLRQGMGLYAAVRPIKLYPGVPTPLADVGAGIDLIVLRENLEGLFASFDAGIILQDRVATDTIMITREGTERIVDFAFHLARRRAGRPLDGKRVVTCVDKANVFRSFAFFRKIFFERAEAFPDIIAEAAYVDAMSLYMVQNPQGFDVLVMENQFGDILSDLGAGIVGGLGVGPSAEIGATRGLFQPSHGSAPPIAGQNIANPVATMLSAAMMLDWLADKHKDSAAENGARVMEAAVTATLKDPQTRTADLGGTATTAQVADAAIHAAQAG